MNSSTRTIVIVGAGFSGTTLATGLLRSEPPGRLHIVLVERAQIARGVAYRGLGFPHLLNVPASRMSANPLDPDEFVRFARHRQHGVTAEDFLPRELYGEYLEATLASAEAAGAAQVQLQRLRAHAIALERPQRSARLQLHLEKGGSIAADTVVLALGNPPPVALPGSEALQSSARYVSDPWAGPALVRPGESVLLAGTGLTMADIAFAAASATRGRLLLHAVSRHGLLPAPQTPLRGVPNPPDLQPLLRAAGISLTQLLRAARLFTEQVERQCGDWREAVSYIREIAPALWERLNLRERRRFLRHVRSYWDVHRHRLAPATWTALHELRRAGRLQLHAGRILNLQAVPGGVRVRWRARGASQPATLQVDRVINCTGPDYDPARSRERLLRSLLAQGTAVRDPLGQGLLTDARGALIDASGRAAGNLFYLGPMRRARCWESTAVAELREHSARLVRELCGHEEAAARVAAADHPAYRPPPFRHPAVERIPWH